MGNYVAYNRFYKVRCFTFTMPFLLKPRTSAMYRLSRDETLYQIWTQSTNPRRSYCDFNIWPTDLERRVTYCARLWDNFTNFDLRQLIHVWIIAFSDTDTLCHAVTLPFDLFTLNFYSASGVMRVNSVYKTWAKSNNPPLRYWRFSTISPCNFRGGARLTNGPQGCVDSTSPNLART